MALAINSQMASATGFFAEGGSGTTPPGPISSSFTNTAGTYMLVGADVGKRGSLSGAVSIASITYGGVALIKIIEVNYSGLDHDKASLWALDAAGGLPMGANTLVVTQTTTGQFDANSSIICGALTFTGQNISTPLIVSQTSSATQETSATSSSLTTPGNSAVGNFVVWMGACGAGITSVNQTETWKKNVNTNSGSGNGEMQYASGTGGALTGTINHAGDFGFLVCVEVNAAAAETITPDKWFHQTSQPVRRPRRMVPSGTTGIKAWQRPDGERIYRRAA